MYVMTRDGEIYIRQEDPIHPTGSMLGRFHHSSFLAGKEIGAAGEIVVKDGKVTLVTPGSGHYAPMAEHLRAFVSELEQRGVDLSAARIIE